MLAIMVVGLGALRDAHSDLVRSWILTKADKERSLAGAVTWNGVDIGGRDEMLCLTDKWRAEGSPEDERPIDWLAGTQAKGFVEFIADLVNAEISGIAKSVRGPRAQCLRRRGDHLSLMRDGKDQIRCCANSHYSEVKAVFAPAP
jgi:hypothetical protein